MKTFRFFSLLILSGVLIGCYTIDPHEGLTSYTINNQTKDTIQLIYTVLPEMEYQFGTGLVQTSMLVPQQENRFLIFGVGSPDLTPSHLFESMLFLSTSNDTLYKMDIIDDKEWNLVDSIVDYGYKVGYYHWTYTFTK